MFFELTCIIFMTVFQYYIQGGIETQASEMRKVSKITQKKSKIG